MEAHIVSGPLHRVWYWQPRSRFVVLDAQPRLWFVACDGHLFATLNEVSDLALFDVEVEWRRERLRMAAQLPAPMDQLSLNCRILGGSQDELPEWTVVDDGAEVWDLRRPIEEI